MRWDKLGGQAGIGCCVLGFFAIFLGWNGAASLDRVPGQFPYLISGGVVGLSLIVIGAALMVIQNQRQDRVMLESRLEKLQAAMERAAAPPLTAATDGELVVAGPTSFHRASCRLLSGRPNVNAMTIADAEGRKLSPCRTCDPLGSAEPVLGDDDTISLRPTPARRPARKRAAR